MKLKFVNTCRVCPEQYDVFDENDKQVGYVRVRHGYCSVRYPDVGGTEIYGSTIRGDGYFYDEFEREKHLKRAAEDIANNIDHIGYQDYTEPGDFIMKVGE